ncbi:MAG: hypothetical protein K8F34_04540 [Candidatus Kuenenia stuttgartiensis]|jgi:DNA-directed RNA polymerase delta subunit|uniref:Putative CsbD-like protein n=1 Tax=Kuenenia stuttgartiensis TaxID=174633 RepID=A0A2C9CCL2_KUEST|nr:MULTISPECIES: hypothetical protein [Kuenenia]MBZ0190940.1 hypothetical protein [Candidatus Kuenenia stuttgartiensis]MCZ7622174.1 hypothetical protein [Candidatus Kuenenia sp.]SOH03385.1 putative CsbD-like protein [Candidatus Kuenenia stuttgartiensis]
MSNDRYEKVAQLVKGIFEKEFGKLSTDDFNEVVKILRINKEEAKTDFNKFYKDLDQDGKKEVDFMMSL